MRRIILLLLAFFTFSLGCGGMTEPNPHDSGQVSPEMTRCAFNVDRRLLERVSTAPVSMTADDAVLYFNDPPLRLESSPCTTEGVLPAFCAVDAEVVSSSLSSIAYEIRVDPDSTTTLVVSQIESHPYVCHEEDSGVACDYSGAKFYQFKAVNLTNRSTSDVPTLIYRTNVSAPGEYAVMGFFEYPDTENADRFRDQEFVGNVVVTWGMTAEVTTETCATLGGRETTGESREAVEN